MARRRRVNRRKKSTKRRPCLGPIRVRSFKRKCPVRRGVSGGRIGCNAQGCVDSVTGKRYAKRPVTGGSCFYL